MINLRAIAAAFRQQMIHFTSDPQYIIPSIIAPFIFTVVTIMLYGDVDGPVVLQAVLGGGVLGMWGNTLFASGWTINYDRMNGTLEPILASPTSLMEVVIGRSVWNTGIGLVNAGLVFVFTEIAFDTTVGLESPVLFFGTLVLTLFSLACIGLVFSAAFVFSRASTVLMATLEFPIYVLSGAMFPVTLLPSWAAAVSYALAPYWGVEAMRVTAMGVEGDLAFDVLMMVVLTAIVLGFALWLFGFVESRVRETGSIGRY